MAELWQALGICPGEVVAFAGGGGKTSLALQAARELAAAGRPVLFTCTTHIWPTPGMEITEQPVRAVHGDVAAIVLAGGAARRFGGGKLLHPWGEGTILEASVSAPLRAGVREVVVVTGAAREPLERLLAPYPIRLVHNPDWAAGMATTLQAGLRSLTAGAQAAVICLGDQPALPPAVLRELIAAYRRTGAPIVAPVAGGRRQNPVLFDRSLFPELLAVAGDEGGRSVIRRHEARMVTVPFADPAWFADIDTPDDLHRQ